MKCIHRSFLKRVLDALDDAEETGGELRNDPIFVTRKPSAAVQSRFATFAQFYPYYLGEHRNAICRRLHFAGTSLVIGLFFATIIAGAWRLLMFIPLAGYGFAWAGHYIFEKNRPATFRHPWYSLAADFVLFRDMLVGKIRF